MGHIRGYYRNYSDDDKAAVLATLAACEGNVYRASKETGVPRKTLEEWNRRASGVSEEVAVSAINKTIDLADWWENHARLALSLGDKRIEDPEVPYSATITGAAIATDKMRLCREQATAINEQREPVTVEERDSLLMALLDEIERNAIDIEPDACDS